MLKTHHRAPATFLIVAGLCVIAGPALAQSPLGIGSAEPSVAVSGPLSGLFAWVNVEQQRFYRALTAALKAMREDPWQLAVLVGLSFAYGVFHAAGPGHGKAVISAYMVANEVALRRGIILSFASALLQGLVALAVVGISYVVLRGTSMSMTDATQGLELASFALIALFGLWLLLRKLRVLFARAPLSAATAGRSHPGHDHHHGHGAACASCGHVHAPDPSVLGQETVSAGQAWSAVMAVGLRPCSGALIVLTFALLNGLYLGGVLSVIAMSIGTAITVSLLATLAVGAKGVAIRYAGAGGGMARLGDALEVVGALVLFLIGLVLLAAALAA